MQHPISYYHKKSAMSKLSFLVVHLARDICLIECIHMNVENFVATKASLLWY